MNGELISPLQLAVLCIAIGVVAALSYLPAPDHVRRRACRDGVSRLVHVDETEQIVRLAGAVEIRAHRYSWLSPQPWRIPRRSIVFFYLGPEPLRLGRLLLFLDRTPRVRVAIAGPHFDAAVGTARLWWRPLDGAIAVDASYTGPATVEPD